jgi:hypothetical protein
MSTKSALNPVLKDLQLAKSLTSVCRWLATTHYSQNGEGDNENATAVGNPWVSKGKNRRE